MTRREYDELLARRETTFLQRMRLLDVLKKVATEDNALCDQLAEARRLAEIATASPGELREAAYLTFDYTKDCDNLGLVGDALSYIVREWTCYRAAAGRVPAVRIVPNLEGQSALIVISSSIFEQLMGMARKGVA